MREIDNKKPEEIVLKLNLCFYKEEPKENTFGSNDIRYEIYYFYDKGIMQIEEVGAFGDRTVVRRFWDRRNRGITESEMLENIQEITKMTLKEFKQKILLEDE